MRILLLNPPFKAVALRDYYCSTVSKANYLWHPIDLLAQSGRLARSHEVRVVDAIAERMSYDAAAKAVSAIAPDVVYSLTSAATWRDDFSFLSELKAKLGFKLVLSGEIFLGDAGAILEKNPFIDGALLNFTSPDLAMVIDAGFDPKAENITSFAWRRGSNIEVRSLKSKGTFSLPTPRHDLFPMSKYRMPWQRHHPFATVMTDYGCPFGCKFCNSRTFGYALREIADIEAELDEIKKMGIRQLFVKDMSFGAVKSHSNAFLDLLIGKNYGFSWNAYSRSDLLDEEFVSKCARAGCHLLQIGVESADEKLLADYGKGGGPEQTRAAFRLMKKHGIDGGAHFIIGLPGDSVESIRRTVDLAIEIDPVYASFNLAMPRLGTEMDSSGWDADALDSSGDKPFYDVAGIDPKTLVSEKRRAVARFYLRPAYWARLAGSIKTRHQLADTVSQALGMGVNFLKGL